MLEPGLIIDMGKYTVTVITRDNGYYKILRKPTMYVSQEIQFKKSDAINIFYFAKRSSILAAAAILVIFAVFFYANLINDKSIKNLAYISLDTDLSIQFTIDGDDRVVDVKFIGNNTKEPLGKWEPRGMEIEDAFYVTIKRSQEKGFIKPNVKNSFLLSGTFYLDDKIKNDELMESDERITTLLKKLKGNMDSMFNGDSETVVIKCDPGYREEAGKNNISLGRYALYSELNRSGAGISLSDAKKITVSDLIKVYRKINPTAFLPYTPLPFVSPYNSSHLPLYTPLSTPIAITGIIMPIVTPYQTSITQTSVKLPNTQPAVPQVSNQNNTWTPNIVNSAAPTPAPIETGTGLRGEYYDNIDLTSFKLTRIDSQINFEWAFNSPPSNTMRNDGSYSMRWMGQLKPPQSGEYTFYVTRDNGVRLWIDGKLIIDKWNSDWDVTDSGTIFLEGGKKYDIKMEYFNNAAKGMVKLEWSSSLIGKAVVPASYLFPATSSLPVQETVPGNGTGLKYEYYDNPDLTSLKATGTDTEINFNWGAGPPSMAITADQKFSIRWTGYIQPVYSEDYTFYITHDDGIRLWIDGKLEIDKWKNGYFNSETRKIPLKAGQKYGIKLEYANNSTAGEVKLEWSSHSAKRSIVPMSRLFPNN